MELLHQLNGWQTLAPLCLLRESVGPAWRHLHSEQQAVLLHQYNALHTQRAHLYSTRQATVRLYDRSAAPVVHHPQELAQVVKRIPAQHDLEHGLALLCSVLYSDPKSDVRP